VGVPASADPARASHDAAEVSPLEPVIGSPMALVPVRTNHVLGIGRRPRHGVLSLVFAGSVKRS
jgi:hypothetical protein